jgi:hypothetical protein
MIIYGKQCTGNRGIKWAYWKAKSIQVFEIYKNNVTRI